MRAAYKFPEGRMLALLHVVSLVKGGGVANQQVAVDVAVAVAQVEQSGGQRSARRRRPK
jgi:hypothetical protein